MFQPETSREVTWRIRNLHSQIPNTGFQRSCSGERWPPDEPRWGILKQYPSRQRLKGEDVGAEFLWSTPRKDPQCPERRAGEGLYLQRIAFQKDCLWLAVKLIYFLCPHMWEITHPPSEVCMHVYINVYLSSKFMCHNYHQACQPLLDIQLFPTPPRCSSVPSVLLEGDGSPPPCCPPLEWVMANGEQGLRSDGQFEWATESDAIRITTYFPGWSIGYLPIIEKKPNQNTQKHEWASGCGVISLWPHTYSTFVGLTVVEFSFCFLGLSCMFPAGYNGVWQDVLFYFFCRCCLGHKKT